MLQVIKQIKPDLAEMPPGGSWQSGQDLLIREQLVDLVSFIDRTAQTVLRFLKVGHNEIEITGCWANSAQEERRMQFIAIRPIS